METTGDAGIGNTNKVTIPRVNQLIFWFFTFNNYSPDDIFILETKFKQICVKYIFQEETGEAGTPHLQGTIQLKKKMRWTQFNLDKRIHWEKAKNIEACFNYCQKDNTRTGKIYRYGIRKPLKLINPNREFQKLILEIVDSEPDDRTIHWFWEETGCIGKSQFVKYIVAKHNAIFIDEGEKKDIMNTTLTEYNKGHELHLFMIDIPRANANKCSYKAIESLKNGMIYSPKYEGGYILFNSPHIMIFANAPPKTEKLSSDRWKIYKIEKDYSTTLESVECAQGGTLSSP